MTTVKFSTGLASGATCPACGHPSPERFYSLTSIPTDSSMLFLDRESAIGHPTGNLQLVFCPGCGLVFNSSFDPSVHAYDAPYEDGQGFSSTFNNFAKSLAKQWIDRYGLKGKTLLEIGCGKGEFLKLMCDLACAKGIGVDPRHRHADDFPEDLRRVSFVSDFFSAGTLPRSVDFICCRHTLEHIGPVGQFVSTVLAAIEDRKEVVIAFEVPDLARVLTEGAFWDVYYEHCSYFSPGSIARLFRKVGFEILDLRLEYGGQYLVIEARPGPPSPPHRLEESIDDLWRNVGTFASKASAAIDSWKHFFAAHAGERIVVWGSGSKGVGFLTTLGLTRAVEYVVDINPFKHGKFMPATGQQIVSPDFLSDYQPAHVIVMNPIYQAEISEMLIARGARANVLTV